MTDSDFDVLLAAAKSSYTSTKSAGDIDQLFLAHPDRFDRIAQVFAETAVELGQDREWISVMKAAEVRTKVMSSLHPFFIRAQEERAARDLATVTAAPPFTFFSCDPRRPPCHRCSKEFTETCEECGIKLCDDHVRRLDDSPRCATHAPNITSASMPKPPGRSR